ncbi:MAG: hypothetical protein P4L82_14015 [Ancalomicrobiaceae bacterium]|nr:hypothetical protein [Ancalomicrobiaceae bacterium]
MHASAAIRGCNYRLEVHAVGLAAVELPLLLLFLLLAGFLQGRGHGGDGRAAACRRHDTADLRAIRQRGQFLTGRLSISNADLRNRAFDRDQGLEQRRLLQFLPDFIAKRFQGRQDLILHLPAPQLNIQAREIFIAKFKHNF